METLSIKAARVSSEGSEVSRKLLTLYFMNKRALYYHFNGQFYTSRFEALAQANGKVDDIQACFYKDLEWFDKFDWTREPTDSWEDILAKRASEIRRQNNYIVLNYSGGSDSSTVLTTFFKNKIPLDEILIIRVEPFSAEVLKELNLVNPNWELDNWAIPYVKALQKQDPHFNPKVTVFTVREHAYYFTHYHQLDVSTQTSGFDFNLNHCACYHTIENYYLNQGKTIINGTPESFIYKNKDTGKYFFEFWDRDNINHVVRDNNVCFFLDYEIYSKQCHLIKNYAKEHNVDKPTRYQKIAATRYPIYDFSTTPFEKQQTVEKYLGPGDYAVRKRNPIAEYFLHPKTTNTLKMYRSINDKSMDKLIYSILIDNKIKGIPIGYFPMGNLMARKYLEP